MGGAPRGRGAGGLAAAPGPRWAHRSHGQLPPVPTPNTVQPSIKGNTGTITLAPLKGPAPIHCTSQEGPRCVGPFPPPAGALSVHRWRNPPPVPHTCPRAQHCPEWGAQARTPPPWEPRQRTQSPRPCPVFQMYSCISWLPVVFAESIK